MSLSISSDIPWFDHVIINRPNNAISEFIHVVLHTHLHNGFKDATKQFRMLLVDQGVDLVVDEPRILHPQLRN